MQRHYDAILFDLDGTLVDTAPDFVIAANALRANHDLPPLPDEEIAMQVSNGAAAVTSRCMEIDPGDSNFESLRLQLLDHYKDCLGQQSATYPGLQALFGELASHSVHWGIVTNKPLRFAEPLLATLGLQQDCAVLVCPDHVTNKKPDPESLLLAANTLQVDAARTLYVGDHHRDIAAGKAAGMNTIAASYGYLLPGDDAASWGADYLAHSSLQLVEQLQQLIHHGRA